ncbi:MAG: UDP-N-acetylmuramoyl-tripeptide--D-alanyl-D-alanine ligase [Oscillospiraceae bacterium]|nr:UDP-N-acetylmuramoyl-tripeptide--D-alanyl-D-alanine ligase [Oscillospiraceae bacterium]
MNTEQIILLSVTALFVIRSCFVFMKSLHMFQLNMYKNGAHFKWLWKNDVLFSFKRTKAKKPLVYTHRVIRLCITSGLLFIGFSVGFVVFTTESYRTLFLLPLFLFFAETLPIFANIVNAPLEKINGNRYIRQAKKIIDSMPNLITIGVTGSYGKTSLKYYLHKLLSAKYNVLMTPESFNTTMGVVKTIRNQLRPTHEIFICEMGMMWKGDIAEICRIVKPRHAVITSIGPQHLETMKTLDNIIREKFSIADTITEGFVFLNYDNKYINERKIDKKIIRYGVNESDGNDRDYKANTLTLSEKGTSFTISALHEKESKIVYETLLIGEHNVLNITGAIAVAHTLGVGLNELVLPVKRLECAPHRLQVKSIGNTVIIDDSFNSNPVGAKAALDALNAFNGVKILITPGMVALGEKSHELNKNFGSQAAACCDYALLIGKKQAPPIKEGLSEAGFPQEKIHIFDSFNEGMAFAKQIDSQGQKKIILIENDLPDNY